MKRKSKEKKSDGVWRGNKKKKKCDSNVCFIKILKVVDKFGTTKTLKVIDKNQK